MTTRLLSGKTLSFPELASNMRLVAIILDENARLTYSNHYFCELTGWLAAEIVGCNWFERFVPRGESDLPHIFARLLEDRPDSWHHENEILCRSNERILIRWNNAAIRDRRGRVIGVAGIGEDITEARQLECEHLDAAERERSLMAAELHDDLGQALYGANLMAHGLQTKANGIPALTSDMHELTLALANAMDTCHRIAHGLSTLANTRGNLVEALHAMIKRPPWSSPHVKLVVREAAPLRLSVTALEHMYRIAQQSLANALQHAFASNIVLSLEVGVSHIELRVADDGVGMAEFAVNKGRLGLRLMRYRANAIHARLSITSVSPHGTLVTVECLQDSPSISRLDS
jgi:PAS domain S-box-containing protein